MRPAEKSSNDRRPVLVGVFLVANALIWYFSAAKVLESVIDSVSTNNLQTLLMWSLHFGTLMFSLLIGALLTKRIKSKLFFIIWTVLGVISPLVLLALNFAAVPVTFSVSFLFGLSLGLGMPNCMEMFTNLTETKNRGKYAGLTMFLSGLGVVALSLFDVGGIALSVLILVIWRLLGLIVLLFQKFPQLNIVNNYVSFKTILSQKSFILYLIPWLMFSLVNYLSIPIQNRVLPEAQLNNLTIIESAVIGIFAVISGFLLDNFGRKRIAMVGFILLGIGYSVLGLSANLAEGDLLVSWLFYTVVDGIAWGIFYVIFVISIWGDLSDNGKSSKLYAIGILPFFISKYLQLVLEKVVSNNISPDALFSFIAFFLFLAILPLVYAPETLPEKVMKDRDLKSYVENAKKKVQKEAEKAKKQEATAP